MQNHISIKNISLYFLAGLFLFSISSCEVDEAQNLEDRSWQLTWSDEFEGPAGQAPDNTKWTYDIGTGDNGWGNQELQYYTNDTKNVSLDGNGNLVIKAINETFGGAAFTSGRIKTQGLFAQKYGRFEARLKTPYGPGLWPAFWMLGENIDEVSWPQCGEIDIMELRGQQPNIALSSLHGPGYSGGLAITTPFALQNNRFDAEFHVFAVEWGEGWVEFFIDETLFKRITPEDVPGEWVYDQPFFMILNVAVGGTFVGFPTPQTPFPQEMVIDYVKVYQ